MAFEELKQRQSAVWGKGPYQRITETIHDIHERVIDRLDPQSGVKWLDLACGTGAVAERAAERGADVTGVDLASARSRPRRSALRSVASTSGVSPVRFADGEGYWELFSTSYGPTKALVEGPDHERREELHRSWVEFADSELADNGGVEHKREWILVYGTRR